MWRLLPLLICISFPIFADNHLYSVLSESSVTQPLTIMQKVEQKGLGTIIEFKTQMDEELDEPFYHVAVVEPYQEVKTLLVFNANTAELVAQSQLSLSSEDIPKLNAVLFMKVKRMSFSGVFRRLVNTQVVYLKSAKVDSDLGVNYLQLELVDPQGETVLAFNFNSQRPLPILKWH